VAGDAVFSVRDEKRVYPVAVADFQPGVSDGVSGPMAASVAGDDGGGVDWISVWTGPGGYAVAHQRGFVCAGECNQHAGLFF